MDKSNLEAELNRMMYERRPEDEESLLPTVDDGRRRLRAETRPMQYADIPRATETNHAAFVHDPVMDYICDVPDATHTRLNELLDIVTYALVFTEYVHYGRALTIDGGDALLLYRPPGKEDTALGRVIQSFIGALRTVRTPERQKRTKELMDKHDVNLKAAFGERIQDMFSVSLLATHPEMQGRGYGSALMAAANAKADALGVATWLSSSNVANTEFYESCRFVTVRELTLGDNNPTWSKPPITVRIMARKWTNESEKH